MLNIEKNFKEEILGYKGLSIVDFWAPWCGPCKMFSPIFEETSKNHTDIKFCKFNVDEDNSDIAKNLGIMSIPTIILFKDGKAVEKLVGAHSEDDYADMIDKVL